MKRMLLRLLMHCFSRSAPSLHLRFKFILLLAYLFVPHPHEARRLWTPDLIQTNGTETVLGESRQLEFWTPSAKTKDYLHMENGQVVPTETWEAISNEDAVLQFGTMLHTNLSVLLSPD